MLYQLSYVGVTLYQNPTAPEKETGMYRSTPAYLPLPEPIKIRFTKWYSGGDLNPQGLLHMDLNHTRLPIPPPEHKQLPQPAFFPICADHIF